MCLGPGTEIQVTGNLYWRKIGPPICLPICWDFFADLGAGLPVPPPPPLVPSPEQASAGDLGPHPTGRLSPADEVSMTPAPAR